MTDQITRLLELDGKATPGPWTVGNGASAQPSDDSSDLWTAVNTKQFAFAIIPLLSALAAIDAELKEEA